MAKRRLNRRQAWRVDKIVEERRGRMQRGADRGEQLLDSGRLGPEVPGLIVANHGSRVSIEDQQQQLVPAYLRQNLDLPVAGDRVVWRRSDDGHGVVVAVMPRHNLLSRPDPRGDPHPLAANIDRMVIVAAPSPAIDRHLIDRYLVAAEILAIPPTILINKSDLLDGSDRAVLEGQIAVYRRLGYHVLFASAKRADGLDSLVQHLHNRVSVLVGQSGVGKSSIINQLLPQQPAREGELTRGFGRHTTSTTTLYPLPGGGRLIDSPGVRSFRLWHLPPNQIQNGFIELRDLVGHCRFRDCRHHADPGCALQQALAEGTIDALRLSSFHRIVEETPS